MQHFEWESDAPAPEESTTAWRAPDWAVYLVMAGLVVYLIAGFIFAIVDATGQAQASGVMVPLSFLFEVVAWPARFVMPALV